MLTREFVDTLARILTRSLMSWLLGPQRKTDDELEAAIEKGVQRVLSWLAQNVLESLASRPIEDPIPLYQSITELLTKSFSGRDELEYLAGLKDKEPRPRPKQTQLFLLPFENIRIPSSPLWHHLQHAIATKQFTKVEGSQYPTAMLEDRHIRGQAVLKPLQIDQLSRVSLEQERSFSHLMFQQVAEMSDFDCDVLECCISEYITRVNPSLGFVSVGIDRILAIRGLAKKQYCKGKRSGYRRAQKSAVLESLSRLRNVWLDLFEIEICEKARRSRSRRLRSDLMHTRAFVVQRGPEQLGFIEEGVNVTHVLFRPADIFALFLLGPARSVALLSAKALNYNPEKQWCEKRLSRFLSWRWSAITKEERYFLPYQIQTLLEAINLQPNHRFPSRSRDRLEKALDRLQRDQVIAGYQYEDWPEERASGHGWLEEWLQTRIIIEPPECIVDSYRPQLKREPASIDELADLLREKRRNMGLSRLRASEQIGIAPEDLVAVETSSQVPRTSRAKCEDWVNATVAS